ncbi:DNA-binding protein [Cupriavidus gilardii]|uniref:DNA-binding protein n=1 Tax=Cupriavidus gilardii TaxID=82541 RepID=UPI00352EF141
MVKSGADVKRELWQRGSTLKEWAKEHGYAYDLVSRVVRGTHRASYGKGYEIAVKLGMKKPGQEAV